MAIVVLVTFLNLFATVFNLLLLIRVLMSWFVQDYDLNWFTRLIFHLTEPVLGPIRSLLPRSGFVDWSPLVTFFALQLLVTFVNRLIGA